tara:strand:+ start:4491 stop:5501 length:1011 start_codon:yes stop_codon:yes gene_type:complete
LSKLYRRADSPNWWFTEGTPPNRIMRSTGTSSLKLAKILKKKWDEELFFKKHNIPQNQRMTIHDACEEFKQNMISKKTKNQGMDYIKQKCKYIDNFNDFMKMPKNVKMFSQVDSSDIDRYVVYRIHEGNVSAKTVADEVRNIKLMFDFATKYKYFESENPALNPDIPKHNPKKRIPIPTQYVLEVLRSKEISEKDRAYWSICYYTGLRASDAGALKKEQVHKDRILIHDTEKTDVPVEIPLHPKLKKMNIVNVYTKKGDRDESTQRFKKELLKIGYEQRADIHSLRHTFNMMMLREGGLSSKDRKKMLAHSSEATTADIYTHMDFDFIDEKIRSLP